MDRKWMSANKMSKEFEDGVKEFVKVDVAHAEDTSKIICPCLKCCYGPVSEKDLASHLIFNGIDKTYTCWTMHGEEKTKSTNLRSNVTYTSNVFEKDTQEFDHVEEFDRVEEFVNVIEEDLRDCPGMFDRLVSDSEKPLYDGCTKFTRLSAVLKLYNLKAGNVGCRDVHWALLVIDPDAGIIYFLDPMDNGSSSRYLSCKRRFENALLIYRAYNQTKPVPSSKSTRIKWISIKCPQQTNTTDCGYFVSRFMKEVVMQYPKTIPDNYFDEYKCGTYSKDKLVEVKDEWAGYMFTNIIPGGSWIKDFLKT